MYGKGDYFLVLCGAVLEGAEGEVREEGVERYNGSSEGGGKTG